MLGSKLPLFSYGRDGHQPYSRVFYTNYKDSLFFRWDEFIPNTRSGSTLAQMMKEGFCPDFSGSFLDGWGGCFQAFAPWKSKIDTKKVMVWKVYTP